MSQTSGRTPPMTTPPRWWAYPVVFLAALSWGIANYALFFRGANTYEFGHYAEIGRNIAEGHGLSTRVVYPATLKLFESMGIAREPFLPVNNRFPLPAYLSALFQRAGGANDFFAVLGTIAAFALWTTMVFHVGAVGVSPLAGILAAVLFASLPTGGKYFVLFNLPDVLFGALVFALHAILTGAAAMSPRRAAVAGFLAGLAWLTRSNLWLWLPLYLLFLLLPAGRPARPALAAAFLGAFGVTIAPALSYNMRWFGSLMPTDLALFLAHKTVQPDQPWLSLRVFDAAEIVRAHYAALVRRAFDRLHTLAIEGPMLWQMQVLLPLAAVGAASISERRTIRLAALTAAAFAVQAAVFAFLGFDSWGLGVGYRYFFWICPWVVLAAVSGALSLTSAWPAPRRRLFLAAWLCLHLAFIVPFYTHDLTSIHLSHPSGRPPRDWPELKFLRDHADAGGVISNLPAHVGWYSRAFSVALPNDPGDVPRLDSIRPMRYLFISFANIGTLGDFPRWLELLSPTADGLRSFCARFGYRVVATFPSGVIIDLKPPRVRD